MSAEAYSVYLAEDEPLARDALLAMFSELPGWRVSGSASDGRAALEDCLRSPPDLLLTDIRMPLLDGLELCAELREASPATQVAFITAHDEHAVSAFRLAAVHYLLKPVTDGELRACLLRVREALHRQRTTRTLDEAGVSLEALLGARREPLRQLVVRSVGRVDIVPAAEIVLLRAAGNYVDVVTPTRTWLHRATLQELAGRLDPARFVQVHRSAIVATARVRRLERAGARTRVVLDQGSVLPVSARYLPALERAFGR